MKLPQNTPSFLAGMSAEPGMEMQSPSMVFKMPGLFWREVSHSRQKKIRKEMDW